MDAIWIALVCVVSLLLGLVIGWRVRGGSGTGDAALQARLAASDSTVAALREQLSREEQLAAQAQAQLREEMTAQRERDRQDAAVLSALSPVQETLQLMHRSVTALERDRHAQFGAVAEQLRRVQETDESLRHATESLTGALRSTTARGTWGESQLRRIVEAAGLTRHVDFDLQVSITMDDGRTGRPDMLVRLPGNKALAVDAKAPLDAFLRATALDDSDQAAAMIQHAKAVRSHVDALAKRAYWEGLSASPELVVCFLPSEAMLSAALDADPALLDHAFAQRVALASPVSLWSVLKTVAYTWTQQDVSEQAQELLVLGTQLYDRLGTLAQHTDDLRAALERAVGAYNRFAGSLESRVLVTARRFPGIDPMKISALSEPAEIQTSPRRILAAEFLTDDELSRPVSSSAGSASVPEAPGTSTPSDDPAAAPVAPAPTAAHAQAAPVTDQITSADIGALRARLEVTHPRE